MDDKRLLWILDALILFLALLLSNLRALVFSSISPNPHTFPGLAWSEISLWLLATSIVFFALRRSGLLHEYQEMWRAHWPLGLLLFLALFSVTWSLDPYVTCFRALELAFATLVASYFGIRFHSGELSSLLFWFGAILLILSLAFVFAFPGAGRMFQPPYGGAWRGVYWHKNHLGSMLALVTLVFGLRAIIAYEGRCWQGTLDLLFFVLSLIVLFFSNSATGYVLVISLHLFMVCAWIWLKVFHRLQRWHYYLLGGMFLVVLVFVLSNSVAVFALFNRSPTMTGRVELWTTLLKEVIPERPWWGHGFGAIWSIEAVRRSIGQQSGWGYQPVIADNGYLDILLHLGIAGIAVFLIILASTTFRSFKYATRRKNLLDFLPVLIMFWALLANVAFSLFAETEVFVWSLIVVVLFMTTRGGIDAPIQDTGLAYAEGHPTLF